MNMEKLLIEKYSIVFQNEKKPCWAVKKKSNSNEIVHPSIPFIGKNYNNLNILMYASAENLTYYTQQEKVIDYLDNDLIAINRHRYCFENLSNSLFFPNVHIEPVTNGALMLIVAYLIKILKEKEFLSPYELAENIAIANFGKFSINTTKKNEDYVNDYNKIEKSIEYVKSDLQVLMPNIIIIPKSIIEHKQIREIINNIIPKALIIPIMQITPTTINTQLAKKYNRKPEYDLGVLNEWHKKINGKIKGKIKNNYYSIYTYLDEIIKKLKTQQHCV
jgi:hypothetical protein